MSATENRGARSTTLTLALILTPTAAAQGNISGWKKGEGDEIAAGDVLAEVETDKATMDWEAQARPVELLAMDPQSDPDPNPILTLT